MYIFFVRRFPDIDHMFPIIYKMAQKNTDRIVILCQNLDYDIHNDFVLNFLKEEFGIDTKYSYHIDESVLRRFLSKFLLSARRIYPKVGVSLFGKLHRLLYGEKWADNLLANVDASALILDFDRVSKYSTKVITGVARRKHIPIVLVTHGVTMCLSYLKKITDIPLADYKIFPNPLKVEFLTTDRDSDKNIEILGSPRYCDEWEKVYNRLLRKTFSCPDLPNENGKLKVLFFERSRIRFDEDHDSVREVRNLNFVNAIFKGRLEKKGPYDTIAGSKYPSARLIQWADVVVMSISSIALEVLWQNKILIYLKYLASDDICVFDQYGACWTVNSQSELIKALKTIHKDRGYRPYRRENVEKLFKDVVYASDQSRDVLHDHVDFLFSVTDKMG